MVPQEFRTNNCSVFSSGPATWRSYHTLYISVTLMYILRLVNIVHAMTKGEPSTRSNAFPMSIKEKLKQSQ